MFDRVYGDLMMLVKSKELNKTALDMNVHYEELLDFLQRLIDTPSLILNREQIVFPSEPKLYSNDKSLTHRVLMVVKSDTCFYFVPCTTA